MNISQISDRKVLVDDFQIPAGGQVTAGLFPSVGTPDIRLPESFVALAYEYAGSPVPLTRSVEVRITPGFAVGPLTNLPPSVTFTGTTPADFLVTIQNTNGGEDTQPLRVIFEASVPYASQPARVA